jgi:glutamyl-tRNA(Gln) amidotransferase subunit E
MDANDSEFYKKIGFMCGIEIHQRLATAEKLFCSCPTAIPPATEKPAGSIRRHQRAVAGELGKIDLSAEYEEFKDREFTYNIYEDNACLVEIDEEPPHELNKDALCIAMAFAKSLKMEIIDEFQTMRKSVVDGSNPSAFQRTILIGLNGEITTEEGIKTKVMKLFLEEESSGIESSSQGSIVYNTDRLGIPLVEIDTDPFIPTPAAARSVALAIGTMLRVSGAVQRGIGTIRQDVNVSIRGGSRVEIKGMQELERMDKFIINEIARQQALLEIKDLLQNAHAKVHQNIDVTSVFADTKVKIIRNQLDKGGLVIGFRLEGFKGLLGKEVNPERRLGTEISDYAKVAGVNGILHSDENMDGYGFSKQELDKLHAALSLGDDDAFVIIAGSQSNAPKAASLARGRAQLCFDGVPLETRGVANIDLCTTRFLRPLPTGSRMYPETDVRPIVTSSEMLAKAERDAPDISAERASLKSQLHNDSLAASIMMSPRLGVYKRVVSSSKVDPALIANVLLQKFTELKRSGLDVDAIPEACIIKMFSRYADGAITKQGIDEILKAFSSGKADVDLIITERSLNRIKGADLLNLISSVSSEIQSKDAEEIRRAIMSRYRLNVDGSELNGLLSQFK